MRPLLTAKIALVFVLLNNCSPAVSERDLNDVTLAHAIPLDQHAPNDRPLEEHIESVQQNVVTVRSAAGHGSGFFVSDRLVLTNAHVIGNQSVVELHTLSGSIIEGRVVAVDVAHDVAAIETRSQPDISGMSLGVDLPPVVSRIYALGSPIDAGFGVSVSEGIVSGYREEDGIHYIQGDVNVQKGSSGGPLVDAYGNVVGIMTKGVSIDNVFVGINFFVPIGIALRALGLE